MALTDGNGAVKAEYTYGTYGELLSGDAGLSGYLYNGKYGVSTDENGLCYMRQRYYNTEIKRFINQDIVVGRLKREEYVYSRIMENSSLFNEVELQNAITYIKYLRGGN